MFTRLVMLLLLVAVPVMGQAPVLQKPVERPKPNPLKSKQFWITLGIRVGLAAWDAETTVAAQKIDTSFREANPLFSGRPSRRELYTKGAAIEAGSTFITLLVWRKSETAGRTMDFLITGLRIAGHTIAIERNKSVRPRRCPSGTTLINGVCT